MTDKKSCENCGRTKHFCESAGLCDQWLRNPRMRMAIPPDSFGYYFYWVDKDEEDWIILEICSWTSDPIPSGVFYVWDKVRNQKVPVSELTGEFQGPIVPNNGGEK